MNILKRLTGLMAYNTAADISYDSSLARVTRQRDELPDYNQHREYFNRLFIKCPRPRPEFCVLDVGCGTGRYFHLHTDADQIVGVDLSPDMLREAKEPFKRELIKTVPTLAVGDTRGNIPVLKDSFDLVYSIGVLGQVVRLDSELIKYLLGFVVQGGSLVLSVLRRDNVLSLNYDKDFVPVGDNELTHILDTVECRQCQAESVSFDIPSARLEETFHTVWIVK